ncbi:histidine kinase [Longilinea arvoryzae]|uniref:histidine kinase n=1 Tax=Longilinea arvoryzae TaxID=360412 RepID=A0A0S7BKK9_9CHLR|nr:cache domain-containing protein [Longilinea arvoryzae]GAP14357.1 histidine kinase [Longilinea arvoryzae]
MRDKHWLYEIRFQNRVILITLLPVIALTLVSILIAIVAYQSLTRNLVLDRNTGLVKVAANSVTQEFDNQLTLLQSTADALSQHLGDVPAQQALLENWEPLLRSFEGGINFLDTDGYAVAATSAAKSRLGLNYAFRSYYQQAWEQKAPVFSPFISEVPSGSPAVVIAVPVFQDSQMQGLLIGVLFVEKHLWPEVIQDLQANVGAQAFLIDSQGTILYHPQKDLIGTKLKDDPVLREMQSSSQALSRLDNSDGDGGRVISYAPISAMGWGIMMTEPWSQLMQPARPYLYIIPGLMLVGLLFSVVLLLWMLQRNISPLSRLLKETQNVAEGGEFHDVPIAGPPEITLLLTTFNRMMSIQKEQRESLRKYAMKILETQEEERKRISRELHDETVQDLVGLSQRLELCHTAIVKDPQAARIRLRELQTLINRAIIDVRRMSNDLRPLILEDLGLAAAARMMCRALEQDLPTAEVDFEVIGPSYRLPSELELVTFRVIQEGLNNIRKHARSATHIEVTIEFKEDDLEARIIDNGPGFEVVKPANLMQQGHLGLAGMAERISLFDGSLEIISTPGAGCCVKLLLPYSPANQAVPN